MSFVTTVKDYIELLNNIYDSVSGNITTETVVSQTLIFIAGSLKNFFWYLFSFNWLRDIAYLPVLVPQLSISLLKENYSLDDPFSHLLTFSTTNNFINSKFLVGFLNSLFICLPISCSHLICLRRLMIQGFPAGIFATLGTILGQWWFLVCVMFGLRWFVLPWFSLESFNYIFGLVLTLSIITGIARERSIKLIPLSDKATLIKFFFQTFFLSWAEQICIFQYFGHLTVGSEPSVFEVFSETTSKGLWFSQSTYLFGLLLGSLFFSALFGWICLFLRDLVLNQFSILYSRWVNGFNLFAIITGLVASFMFIPYYGTDYLLAGPLGFVSEDKAFENSIFSSIPPKDFVKHLGQGSNYKSLDTDIVPFDRARYLRTPARQTFEDLNFQGEYAWTARQDNRFFFGKKKGNDGIRKALDKLLGVKNYNVNNEQDKKELLNLIRQRIQAIDTREKSNVIPNQKRFLPITSSGTSKQDKKFLNSSAAEAQPTNLLKTDSSFPYDLKDKFENKTFLENSFEKTVNLKDQNPSSLYHHILMERVENKNYNTKLHNFLDVLKQHMVMFKEQNSLNLKVMYGILFKKKYYSNNVYKFLLNCDIDLFLSRQPKSHLLTSKQEQQLVEKRNALATYYDSLRNYNQLPYLEWFQEFFQGSKSYADRVYNQQFKGTLFITRRLFAISLDSKQNPYEQRVLKYDQPLYKSFTTDSNPLLHEELLDENLNKLPFLELTESEPFYSGWDQSLRKLVVTNRFFPKRLAGIAMNVPSSNEQTQYSPLYNKIKNVVKVTPEDFKEFGLDNVIEFTAWPLSKNILEMPETDSKVPYTTLFQTRPIFTEEEIKTNSEKRAILELFNSSSGNDSWNYKTLPPNIRIKKTQEKQKDFAANLIMPPSRGGFVWPGNKYLQFDLIKLFRK